MLPLAKLKSTRPTKFGPPNNTPSIETETMEAHPPAPYLTTPLPTVPLALGPSGLVGKLKIEYELSAPKSLVRLVLPLGNVLHLKYLGKHP